MSKLKYVLAGGLVAGLLDITDAFIFFGMKGIKLMSITQAIAAGLLGPSAFKGGVPTFLLGLGLHFAMAIVMAFVFYTIAKLIPLVANHIIVSGLVYGLALFYIMNWIVVPNSGFHHGQYDPFPPPLDINTINALFCHLILVGTTIALFTRKALKA